MPGACPAQLIVRGSWRKVETMAKTSLRQRKRPLSEIETEIFKLIENSEVISRDVSSDYKAEGGFGGVLADRITSWAGSWTFILLFLAALVGWAVLNTNLLGNHAFDPYPFIFLNLVLSMIAAIHAPVILMAANRQADRDRIAARHDYEVNLKAEIEIMALHEKLEELKLQEIEEIRATVLGLSEALKQMNAGRGKRG
jgi:uncharacterized membrane protein